MAVTTGTVEGDLERTTVLLVDDDEHWTRATAQLLERRRDAFVVETAHDVASGREQFAALDPDCVVSDYQLGDGTGLELLDTVREHDPDRPFVLVTGRGDETVASDAIGRGVTDYIRKHADDGDGKLLASRIENAVRSYRTERTLERERRSKTALLDILTATTAETELARQCCRRLVSERRYACAWLGREHPIGVQRQAIAGEEAYPETITDGQLPATEPARRALDENGPVVDRIDATGADWEQAAAEHGFEAAMAIPVTHDGVRFGVLAVYADDTVPVDDRERADLVEYADTIGYALTTAARKRSLVSAAPVRVQCTIDDDTIPAVAIADSVPPTTDVAIRSAVLREDGTTLYVVDVDGAPPAAVADSIDAIEGIRSVTADGSDPVRCEVVAAPPTPEERLAEHGARFERTVVEGGVATVTCRVADDGQVSTISETLTAAFENVAVSTIWTDDDHETAGEDPLEPLTARQREVLRHALDVGYFERPRETSATELAAQFDVARATVTQHLRRAQQQVFETLFDR
jgi:predicted DNA binding protein/ActR/RegA family two-component response regulator